MTTSSQPADHSAAANGADARRRRRRRRVATLGIVLLTAALIQWRREIGLQIAGRWYAAKAGGPSIDAAEAGEWIDRRGAAVIDVRSPSEFAVSHLQGAVRVSLDDIEAGKLPDDVDHGAPVVVYCTVGYRSGLAAERLLRLGYDAGSVRGGILGLAQTGRPLEDAAGPTRRVHTWKQSFAWMLPADHEPVYPDE